jgi:hypothetical protein
VCDGLGVEPDADTEEDALRNSFVCRMVALGRLVRERIRGSLHHGVKRAMAVVWSGFMYDMELIADGFITDPDRMDEENEDACLGLIGATEDGWPSCSRSRWFRLLAMRACEPNLAQRPM